MPLKHTNPTQPGRDRDGYTFWAHAPYNFVPLPERMVRAEEPPAFDRYGPELLTGRIECELETCAPLYVRGMMTPDEYRAFGEKGSDRPHCGGEREARSVLLVRGGQGRGAPRPRHSRQ